MIHFASVLAILSFACVAVFSITSSQRDIAIKIAQVLFTIGVLALSVATVPMLVDDYLPLLPGYLLAMVVGWACLALLFRYRKRWRADNLLRLAAPSLFVILTVQTLLFPHSSNFFRFESPYVRIHTAIAITAQGTATMVALLGALIIGQSTLAKKKIVQTASYLPLKAIDHLKAWMVIGLWTSFLLLTLSLVSGMLLTFGVSSDVVLKNSAKVIWSLSVWLLYAGILIGRQIFSLSHRKVAVLSCLGFALLALTYFGVVFLQPGSVR